MNTILFRKYLSISHIALLLLIIISCDWPFNTKKTNNDIFELTLSHDIVRVMPNASVNLTWSEITVENFKNYKIERKIITDTSWTDIEILLDPFQLSYIDIIGNDDDLIYRIGIVDSDDNIIWATESISIPRTTSILVPDEFEAIQPAFVSELIDDGDTIIVYPGIYPETLRIAGKDVLIKSKEGFKTTILQPTFIEDPNQTERVANIFSGTLEGFTVELGNPHHAGSGSGIALARNGTVQNCLIDGNQTFGKGGGVFLTDDGNLYNNIISNNFAVSGSGIYAVSAHGEIINNTIVDNDIVIKGNCEGLLFRNNIVYNSQPDLSFFDQASVTIDYSLFDFDIGFGSNNIFEDPQFVDNVDFLLEPTSLCVDAGHPDDQYLDVDGTRNDIGAYGGPGAN